MMHPLTDTVIETAPEKGGLGSLWETGKVSAV